MRTLYRDFPLMAERYDCEHFNGSRGHVLGLRRRITKDEFTSSVVAQSPIRNARMGMARGTRVAVHWVHPACGPWILGIYLQSRTCSIQHRTMAACMHR